MFAAAWNAKLPLFFCLEIGPRSSSGRCPSPNLDIHTPYCLSSICHDRLLSSEIVQGEDGVCSVDSSSMGGSTLVPGSPEQPCGVTLPTPPNLLLICQQEPHPLLLDGHLLASVRNSFTERGIPKEACDNICSSWRRGTNKSYSSAWNKWASWCNQQGISPISAHLNDILLFLSVLKGI